jgi:uncharacterized LabA/DUF88 family protein
MDRVITYIDGFNLYFGLKDSGWQRYYWLNQQLLSENLLKPGQKLIFTKYFTSRVAGPTGKHQRQTTYLEALDTLSSFSITFGKYQHNPHTCPRCGFLETIPNEKMTDVNIAVELLGDAYQNRYDTAFLISADSDLTAPVNKVQQLFPGKRIVVAFPPKRVSKELMKIASANFVLGRSVLARSQFPEQVIKANGFILRRPVKWK